MGIAAAVGTREFAFTTKCGAAFFGGSGSSLPHSSTLKFFGFCCHVETRDSITQSCTNTADECDGSR